MPDSRGQAGEVSVSSPERPLVTIVTPSYNQGRFIAETIESVLGQDYEPIEYIVMDAGSTDETVEILKRYGGRLRWISQKDAGQSDAIHRGFSMGRGDILAWLNADDVYADGAVRRAVDVLVAHPNAGLVYGHADFIDPAGRRHGQQIRRTWSLEYLLTRRNFISQPTTFFRRTAYEAVGGLALDLHYVMDYDLWIRLGRQFPVCAIPDVVARVRMYRETKTNTGGLERVEEIRRMVARHGRTRLPEWHYWDFVRESIRASRRAARAGRSREALRLAAKAAPWVAHPMVLYSVARHVRWRAALVARDAVRALERVGT